MIRIINDKISNIRKLFKAGTQKYVEGRIISDMLNSTLVVLKFAALIFSMHPI